MTESLLSPDASGLDRAAWGRLGTIAESTQTALAQDVPTQTASQAKAPGILGQALAEAVKAFQRDWHRLFHPLESIREWWASQTQGQTPYQSQGTPGTHAPSQAPAPGKASPVDATWTQVRDQLFEAAKDPKADPQHVADGIVASIPTEHRAALVERLGWLAEMAHTTAKALEQAPETAQAIEKAPTKPVIQRQVPPQPLPPTPKRAERQKAPTKASEPTHAKAR